MNIYAQKQRWKLLLLAAALLIGAASLWYTNKLVKSLADEERKKINLWAEATKKLADVSELNTDLGFPYAVISDNTTIPVILTDSSFGMIMLTGTWIRCRCLIRVLLLHRWQR